MLTETQTEERPAVIELMVLVNHLARLSLLEKEEVDKVRYKMLDLISKMSPTALQFKWLAELPKEDDDYIYDVTWTKSAHEFSEIWNVYEKEWQPKSSDNDYGYPISRRPECQKV